MKMLRTYLVLVGVGLSVTVTDTRPDQPVPSGGDSNTFYQTLVASAGTAEVYLAVDGKYKRTIPLYLDSYDLSTDRRELTVKLSFKLTEQHEKQLDDQMKQYIKRNPGFPPATSARELTVINPHFIKVTVKGQGDKTLGKKEQSNLSRDGKTANAIGIDTEKVYPFAVTLPEALPNDVPVERLRVVIEADYLMQQTSVQYSSYESVIEEGMSLLEKAVGGHPNPGDYVSRDVLQKMKKDSKMSQIVRLINAPESDAELLRNKLDKALSEPMELGERELSSLKSCVIWTPELGRIEIQPEKSSFEDNEKAIKQSSESSISKKIAVLSDEAVKTRDFVEWYKKQQSKRSENTATSGSIALEAEVIDLITGKGSASGSYTFTEAVEGLTEGSAKGDSYRDLHKLLQRSEDVQKAVKNNFEGYWKGKRIIFGTKPKALDLAVIRDVSKAQSKFAEIYRGRTTGFALKTIKTLEEELKSNRATSQEIVNLQAAIAELRASVKNFGDERLVARVNDLERLSSRVSELERFRDGPLFKGMDRIRLRDKAGSFLDSYKYDSDPNKNWMTRWEPTSDGVYLVDVGVGSTRLGNYRAGMLVAVGHKFGKDLNNNNSDFPITAFNYSMDNWGGTGLVPPEIRYRLQNVNGSRPVFQMSIDFGPDPESKEKDPRKAPRRKLSDGDIKALNDAYVVFQVRRLSPP
jgi:hypothetical protein